MDHDADVINSLIPYSGLPMPKLAMGIMTIYCEVRSSYWPAVIHTVRKTLNIIRLVFPPSTAHLKSFHTSASMQQLGLLPSVHAINQRPMWVCQCYAGREHFTHARTHVDSSPRAFTRIYRVLRNSASLETHSKKRRQQTCFSRR